MLHDAKWGGVQKGVQLLPCSNVEPPLAAAAAAEVGCRIEYILRSHNDVGLCKFHLAALSAPIASASDYNCDHADLEYIAWTLNVITSCLGSAFIELRVARGRH